MQTFLRTRSPYPQDPEHCKTRNNVRALIFSCHGFISYRGSNTPPLDVAARLSFRGPLRRIALAVAQLLLFILANDSASHFTVITALSPLIKVPDVATDVRTTRYVYRAHLRIAEVVVHVPEVVGASGFRAQHGSLAFSVTATSRAVAPPARFPLVLQVENGRGRGTAMLRMIARI